MKTTRRRFLQKVSLSSTGIILGANSLSNFSSCTRRKQDELLKQRELAKNRKRRIILNNDGNDYPSGKVTPESFLNARTNGLEQTQVDSIFYCTGVFNLYTHNSSESEIFTSEGKKWCHELIRQGTDSLEVMVNWCRANDREVFWSMRMNDTHDAGNAKLLSQWKKDHPEYMIGQERDYFPFGNFRWSSLNYALQLVRNKVFAILSDVCSRYDIDGIELDFFRSLIYFEETMQGKEATDEQREAVTSLMRQIREMTEKESIKKGHPILIGIRTPDSLGYCRGLGLDVQAWLGEGLFDLWIVGDCFRLEPWENTVDSGKKYNVPIYGCLEKRRLVEKPEEKDKDYLQKVFRGESYNAFQAGISGIYLFNEFDQHNPMLNELGSRKTLNGLDRIDQTAYVQQIFTRPEVWLATASKYFIGEDTSDDPDTIINENLVPFRHRQKFRYKRKIIYNNDGNENLSAVEVTPQSFLDKRTTGLENTNISSIFYCTGLTTRFTHFTKIGARFGYDGVWGKQKGFPAQLDKFGVDSLTLQINYARKHHREVFWSLRMNDTHDSSLKENFIHNTFKEEHPECLMGKPGDQFPYGNRWSALDYSKEEVRKFIFSLIEEVVRNYDVDGIELDFFRHLIYFKEVMLGEVASEQSLQSMTDLMKDIRRMTEKAFSFRGRPLPIAIRIPDSLEYCKAIGLDVRTWLENDLIDILIGGGYFRLNTWQDLAKIGKDYNVPVYACIVSNRIIPKEKSGDPVYKTERFRGEALEAWEAGVDGIYTYNLWYNQNREESSLFTEMGDPVILQKLERIENYSPVAEDGSPVPETYLKGGNKFIKMNAADPKIEG